MAIRIWIGTDPGNEGAFGTANNWSGGAAPVSGDTVLFLTGSQSVTSGLDQSAVDLEHLRIGSGYTGSIGSAAAPLQIGVSNSSDSTFHYNGSGSECWIDFGSGVGADNVIVTGTGVGVLHLAGKMPSVVIRKGTVHFDGGGTVTQVRSSYDTDQSNDVAIVHNGGTIANLVLEGGIYTSNVDAIVTTLNVIAGVATIQDGTATTVQLFGGTVYYRSPATLTTLTAYGGAFTTAGDPRAKTITNSTMYAGSTVHLGNGAGTVTLSNPITYYGGTLTLDDGKVVTPS